MIGKKREKEVGALQRRTLTGTNTGVRTRQKRGPEVGPPSSPLFTLRDGAEVGDHTQQKRGPVVGPPCSPFYHYTR